MVVCRRSESPAHLARPGAPTVLSGHEWPPTHGERTPRSYLLQGAHHELRCILDHSEASASGDGVEAFSVRAKRHVNFSEGVLRHDEPVVATDRRDDVLSTQACLQMEEGRRGISASKIPQVRQPVCPCARDAIHPLRFPFPSRVPRLETHLISIGG